MKVHTTRSEYAEAATLWTRCRDVYAGGDAVKSKGVAYLPALGGQDDADYKGYLARAEFFEATARTVDGLTGVVMRKPPEVSTSPGVTPWLADVTLAGVTMTNFAQTAMQDVLVVGRGGVLIDYAAAAKRPYFVWYRAEAIVNWRSSFASGDERLSMVVLKEEIEAPGAADPFQVEKATRYRVLELVNGVCMVTIYVPKQTDNATEWVPAESTPEAPNPAMLQRAGQGIDEIPFVFVGPEDTSPQVRKPPLLGLVDTNLSHYRTSADLEHGAHFTGLPTPYVTGHKSTSSVLKIGAGVAWILPEADASVGMLEFTGQGLGALERLMDRKEVRMAILGARLLEASKNVAEAADTHRIRQSGDESVLKRIAGAVSEALTTALQWMAWWAGSDEAALVQTTCALNTSFAVVTATPEEVKTWLLAVQAGRMSNETFYYLCTRAELTRPGVTFKDEQHAIAADDGGGPEPEPEPAVDPTADPAVDADPAGEGDAA